MENWRKNLHGLTEEVMKQVKLLESIDGNDSKSNEGQGDRKRKHYFDHMVETVTKEVG